MKKLATILILLISTSVVFSQHRSGTIKFGNFSPGATESGFVIGYEGSKYVDKNFDIGWSVDWFHKDYIDQDLVSEYNEYYGYFESELNEVRAKTNLHSIPVLFNMRAKFPMAPRLTAYINGGIGVEGLLIFYRDYQYPDEDEFDAAFDFNWRLGLGFAFQLGRRSDLITELTYHSSSPSWSYEINDPIVGRKRNLERVFDMSGLMARIGFKFYY